MEGEQEREGEMGEREHTDRMKEHNKIVIQGNTTQFLYKYFTFSEETKIKIDQEQQRQSGMDSDRVRRRKGSGQ